LRNADLATLLFNSQSEIRNPKFQRRMAGRPRLLPHSRKQRRPGSNSVLAYSQRWREATRCCWPRFQIAPSLA